MDCSLYITIIAAGFLPLNPGVQMQQLITQVASFLSNVLAGL